MDYILVLLSDRRRRRHHRNRHHCFYLSFSVRRGLIEEEGSFE